MDLYTSDRYDNYVSFFELENKHVKWNTDAFKEPQRANCEKQRRTKEHQNVNIRKYLVNCTK